MLPPDTDLLEWLLSLEPAERERAIDLMGPVERESFDRDWASWAHEGQGAPEGDWRTWVIMAGRGFGKTLAGSQWITALVAGDSLSGCPHSAAGGQSGDSLSGCPQTAAGDSLGDSQIDCPQPLSIALVGATLDEARRVMVEGRSGLIAVADALVREWNPSLRRLTFTTGAEAILFSGASPEQLRGPEHHFAWCDELAKWEKPGETWDMLQLGLRLGQRPRAIVTTTPRPGPALRRIMAETDTIVTGGPTAANPHTSPAWKRSVESLYAGTRLGRQELQGELLSDAPGALWTVELLEKCRLNPSPHWGEGRLAKGERGEGAPTPPSQLLTAEPPLSISLPPGERGPFIPCPAESTTFRRVIIAVDPPSGDGTCGIIACAKDEAGIAHILADHSVTARSPEGWSRAVADAARIHASPTTLSPSKGEQSVTIVAEANQGGKMVAAVLRTADPDLRVKLVTATVGKAERAAPVAMLFEAGKVVLHGRFPELEAELLGMIAGGDYEGPGVSPDRADAMVWGLTELMLASEQAPPRVRTL